MNISNCDGLGLIHRLIKLVEATNLEHGSQDGADGGDSELNGGGGSEMEDLRHTALWSEVLGNPSHKKVLSPGGARAT